MSGLTVASLSTASTAAHAPDFEIEGVHDKLLNMDYGMDTHAVARWFRSQTDKLRQHPLAEYTNFTFTVFRHLKGYKPNSIVSVASSPCVDFCQTTATVTGLECLPIEDQLPMYGAAQTTPGTCC